MNNRIITTLIRPNAHLINSFANSLSNTQFNNFKTTVTPSNQKLIQNNNLVNLSDQNEIIPISKKRKRQTLDLITSQTNNENLNDELFDDVLQKNKIKYIKSEEIC